LFDFTLERSVKCVSAIRRKPFTWVILSEATFQGTYSI
jgi:hypothetical protein